MRAHRLLIALIIAGCSSANAKHLTCDQLKAESKDREAFLNPPLGADVKGEGRLYFHSAPNEACRVKTVFVVPGDHVFVYTSDNGWYSVMYLDTKGNDFHGWVSSDRLKFTGTLRPKS